MSKTQSAGPTSKRKSKSREASIGSSHARPKAGAARPSLRGTSHCCQPGCRNISSSTQGTPPALSCMQAASSLHTIIKHYLVRNLLKEYFRLIIRRRKDILRKVSLLFSNLHEKCSYLHVLVQRAETRRSCSTGLDQTSMVHTPTPALARQVGLRT